jgi:ABC-2 type transport system ATP-binding protein
MIVFERVGRAFGEKWAVRDLSLEIPRGEEGAITIAGHDIVKDPIAAKSVTGYVPDRSFLYEKLTVREFLTFVASVYGLDKRTAEEKIETLSEKFGIKDIEDSYIEGCSQGMRQRILFASALMHEPEVLVFDEPIVGLDPFGVELVKDLIRELSASGTTVFLATHILAIAADLCQRVGLIDNGKLIALKRREEVAANEGGLEGLFMKELKGRGE